ncbi:MAG: hypothetical protein K6G65_03615 [Lachnospiraceae bacterium]|nr:hypothetical protein [Lachnospiraceae bacterium]
MNNKKLKVFSKASFAEQKNAEYDKLNEGLVKVDPKEKPTMGPDGYAKEFSVNNDNEKVLKLHNKKGQGNYGLCWAASCATIINYEKGKNYSAFGVADKMGIGYNSGANIAEVQLALQKYGVNYTNLNHDYTNIMSWNSIKSNIKSKHCIYVASKSYYDKNGKKDEVGHGVTVYGYKIANNKKYIKIWNSALGKNGSGDTQVVKYKTSGPTFTQYGRTYTWKYSLSY